MGKHVQVFLTDGTPGGLLTGQIMNWTGQTVVAPRSRLAQLLERREVRGHTGVYLLIGDDPTNVERPRLYIGEADDVATRLRQHTSDKLRDVWERVVVLTSKDANLTKAHARYLEARFIRIADRANRATLLNGTSPPLISLPEADVSDMEEFIAQARIVLPILGVNFFRARTAPAPSPAAVPESGATGEPGKASEPSRAGDSPATSPVFELRQAKRGVDARAQEIDGEFTVLAGSTAARAWSGVHASYERLRAKQRTAGMLVVSADGRSVVVPKDLVFASPSAASAVLLGRSSNGRKEWVVRGTGQTYGDWQQSTLDAK